MNTSLNFSNGKENKITKRYYCDNSSEIIPEDYESTDQIYAINDNKLYEIEVSNEKTASGSIASFPDGADNVPVEELAVSLEPIQNLNGQTSPYPAGGGKNKFDPSVYSAYVQSDGKYRGRAGEINPIYINIPSSLLNTPCTFSFYADLTNSGTLSTVLAQVVVGGTNKNGNRVDNGAVGRSTVTFTPTNTDDYVHITFGSNGSNEFTFYNIQLEASSAVTDYAPYSNICPITGHTQAELWRSGVNVWDEEWEVGALDFATGLPTTSNDRIRTKNYIQVVSGESYYCVATDYAAVSGMYARFYDSEKAYIGYLDKTGFGNSGVANRVIVIPDNCKYMKFVSALSYGSTYRNDYSINYPSTDTTYHAHSIVNISIPLGQTVYGGTVDVVQGVLSVDRAMVDMGDRNYTKGNRNTDDTGYVFYFRDTTFKNYGELISSQFEEVFNIPNWESLPVNCCNSANGSYIIFCADYSDAATFKTAMNGVQLVYELATPIEIQLTAHELTTLLGQNNIWSDSGNVAVEYRADIQRYITKVISEAIS